jgi:hypothetical protein
MAIANITNNILVDSGVATSSLLPLSGGTLTGALNGTTGTFTSGLTIGSLASGSNAILSLANNSSGSPRTIYYKASDSSINFTSTGAADVVTITNSGNFLLNNNTSSNLGTNTKFRATNGGGGGASLGSVYFGGTGANTTGIPINQTDSGGTLLLIASRHTDAGTSTHSAVYLVRFYYDGNNAPSTIYLGGTSDFITFGVISGNLSVQNSGGGACSVAWFGNK